MARALAHGLGIAFLVYATANIAGGHLNPAVTFAAFLTKKISAARGLMFVAAQLGGAVIGALLLLATIPDAADTNLGAHALGPDVSVSMGLEPDIPIEMEPVVQSFTTWRQDAGLDIQLTETMVYSGKYRYAGAMDAVAYRDGQLVALDWKTGNGLYPEHLLQVAAYAKALEEMSGESVTEAWVVRLGKKAPEFEVRKVGDLDTAFIAFRAALYLWKAMRGGLL